MDTQQTMTNSHSLLAQHLFTQRSAISPASEHVDLKPHSIDDAFAVQQQMIALSNQDIAGWISPQDQVALLNVFCSNFMIHFKACFSSELLSPMAHGMGHFA
mgnify:CR=1 FL=1